ncbi:MAG TPA: T9SS type A sorting domain-containing protein, partial [Anaerolineae bacterium]|nr:T9SS type A sorting domain-containing protein [Anaerolineae bacterium]
LDVSKSAPRVTNPFNQLIGTFNLQNYNANDHEVRLAFHFKQHGITQLPHANNKVWIRGQDNQPWVELFDLGANQPVDAGIWKNVPALDVNEKLKAAGQNFSSSTQVRIGQYAFYSMADNENFAGLSFDDISVFLAENDAQLLSIVGPTPFDCSQGQNLPVTIRLHNGMPTVLTNVPVRYRVNGGAWVNGFVPSIPARGELDYSFGTQVSFPASGTYTLEAEVNLPGDNVPGNNSRSATILRQPAITIFPYYQDFESGAAGFLANGKNNTWELGTPASVRINTAASGTNAWKTRLVGDYNNLELSYLYTPCFDISTLTNPMLSFRLAYSFEDCRQYNVVCDAGWMEYSTDGGNTWQKLGAYGEGQNWYDYQPAQVWMLANQTNWQEATIPLPKFNGVIRLRYVVNADLGSTREGLAIDNFHIYNGGPLSNQWLSFSANLLPDQRVDLQWRVANAQPGDQFLVQVSRLENNPGAFNTLATVPVVNGGAIPFTQVDNPAQKSGQLFYRVIWQKLDGSQLVSPVRKIRISQDRPGLQVMPNPAHAYLLVTAATQNQNPVTLRILTSDGRTVYSTRVTPQNGFIGTRIELANLALPKGVYFLEMKGEKESEVVKWMKQ